MRKNPFLVSFKWIGASTWILQVDGFKIGCDPILCPAGTVLKFRGRYGFKRLDNPVYEADDFQDVGIWLLTHGHEDHIDAIGTSKIKAHQSIVAHRNVRNHLSEDQKKRTCFLKTGDVSSFVSGELRITVEAMPAVHGSSLLMRKIMGGVNGYWISIAKPGSTLNIYVTADTVNEKSLLTTLQSRRADILIPNMGGVMKGSIFKEITLTASMLKDFTDILRPRTVFPVHFGSFSHYKEPIQATQEHDIAGLRILSPGETASLSL